MNDGYFSSVAVAKHVNLSATKNLPSVRLSLTPTTTGKNHVRGDIVDIETGSQACLLHTHTRFVILTVWTHAEGPERRGANRDVNVSICDIRSGNRRESDAAYCFASVTSILTSSNETSPSTASEHNSVPRMDVRSPFTVAVYVQLVEIEGPRSSTVSGKFRRRSG